MRGRHAESKREKSDDLTRAKHRALYILERGDRTEAEIRRKLEDTYLPETVDAVLEYLREYDFLDDRRYAARYLEYRCRDRSRRSAVRELIYEKGVDRELVGEVLEELPEADEREQIREWMLRRHIDPENADERELGRFYRFLMRRGYRSDDILSEFRA